MKKLTLVFLLSSLVIPGIMAQNFNEWWRQKQTQRRYLLEQVVALRAYTQTAWKCYETAQAGLGFIGEIKEGDFNLHSEYFRKLQSISPAIANYSKIAEAIKLQKGLMELQRRFKQRDTEFLNDREKEFSKQVISRIINHSLVDLNHLTLLLTERNIEMTEGERIKSLEKLSADMEETYSFALILDREMEDLASYREREKMEKDLTAKVYGIQRND